MPSSESKNGERPRVLVVATAPVRRRRLRGLLEEIGVGASSDVHVVSPASRLSWLQWLANEEDAAREEAEEVARRATGAVDDPSQADAGAGDVDPLQAAEDALAQFPADELVVVVAREDERTRLEQAALEDGFGRFGLPVRYLVADVSRDA